jgi:hypothetical protein
MRVTLKAIHDELQRLGHDVHGGRSLSFPWSVEMEALQ